jgi:hypothetical protein
MPTFDPIYELFRFLFKIVAFFGFIALIVAIFVALCHLAAKAKALGIPSTTRIDDYINHLKNHHAVQGKMGEGYAFYSYPIWWLFYATTVPVPQPEPVAAIDIGEIDRMLKLEMRIALPEMPDFADKASEAGHLMMMNDLIEPRPDGTLMPIGFQVVHDAWKKRVANLKNWSPLKILREAFVAFFNELPSVVGRSDTGLHASLLSLISEQRLNNLFYNIVQHDVFAFTYGIYTAGWGLAEESIKAHKFDRDSPAHIKALLFSMGSMTGFVDAQLPIKLPQPLRFEGTWIVAPQGRGKTTLLSALLKADLEEVRQGKACVIIFDSKGDLLDHVKQLGRFAPGGDLAGKLTLIEPSANLALNPLQLGASQGHNIALLEYIFRALLETKTTSLQSTLFRSVLIALRTIPGATFSTFREFIQDGWQPYGQYIHQLHHEDRDFFLKGEFDSKTYRSTRDELLWRIRDLPTRVPLLREMFRAPETKIDMARLMDTPGVIVIDNSIAQLAESGSEFFSRFFIALILAAAQQRADRKESDKLPVYVYLDEAQTVIAKDESVETIIRTCRSQNIAMTFAHQSLSQLKIEGVQSSLADCAIRFTNPDKDAKALADDFRTNAETLQQIPKGKFALYVREDNTTKPIIVSVPNEPVSKQDTWPKMSAPQLHAIREDMRARYSFVPRPQSRETESPRVQQGEVVAPRQRGGQNVTPLTGEIVEPQRDSTGRVIISEKYGERTVIVEKGTKPQKW